MKNKLLEEFGEIDIYLFDQLLKGTFDNCIKVLDAGCSYGRNIHYFLKNNFDVYGVDQNEQAIEEVKKLAEELSAKKIANNFVVAPVENMPFEDNFFDLVICSAVLHFASNHVHFDSMLKSCWRVLKPGGFLFTRLATNIGIEKLVVDVGNGRFKLPDGSERYLADQQKLIKYTAELGATLFEPIKTTNVQNLRCMTTWCLRK